MGGGVSQEADTAGDAGDGGGIFAAGDSPGAAGVELVMEIVMKRMQVGVAAMMLALGATALDGRAEKAFPLPTYSAAVDKAVSEENLRAVVGKTEDAEVLLGLGFVAPTGSAARHDLLAKAVKLKPDYAAAAIVVRMEIDGVDDASIEELIKLDAENALGYYLRAVMLQKAGKHSESLAAFRKGAACAEMRLYGTTTAGALLKALDVLQLTGRDRLAALSWTATRAGNFCIINLQPMLELGALARRADLATRKEISELLLVLGGQLYATNFQSRQFAQRAVTGAFRLKAEIAAEEKSPTMNGYVTVVQALTSVQMSWPGIAEKNDLPLETAQLLPSGIYECLPLADPAQREAAQSHLLKADLPERDRAAFEKAKQDFLKAAEVVVAAALADPDEILGAYLRGSPPMRKGAGPWESRPTYVERVMSKRPEVFKAVAACKQAADALREAGRNDPRRRNAVALMGVGLAIHCYAREHKQALPQSLEALWKDGKYLKDASEAQSIPSGKSFVYAAAGEKLPEGSWETFILAYDDHETDGCYLCVLADGHVEAMPVKQLKELLAKRGK